MGLTIREYLDNIKGKKVAVLGIGVSNTPLIRMLLRAGVEVTACDKRRREDFDDRVEELKSLGANVCLGEDYLEHLEGQDIIFRTPGMRPDLPQLTAAVRRGSVLTSEMEVFFQVCPCPIIGVTGSDGKTTTTTLISEFLKEAGLNVYLGGNIGKPLLPDVKMMEPSDFAVVELSSFQLMTMSLSPHIAVVTNLAPNHLDVHKSMEEYISAKKNIFLHQNRADQVVLNADNAITAAFAAEAPGSVTVFSRQGQPSGDAVFFRNDAIWLNDGGGERLILRGEEILLPGDHNVENYMAAIAAVKEHVPVNVIRSFAAKFSGVEHRIELVRTLDGVRYYNDSIASSPTRTMAGLKCFPEKVILIAGGYDKHIPFDDLGPAITEHVKRLILTGNTASKIRKAVEAAPDFAEGRPVIKEYTDFKEAVLAAHGAAESGDVVILSPACASFDQFRNFMERGNTFKHIVLEL